MESENWFGNTTNMTSDQEFFFYFSRNSKFFGLANLQPSSPISQLNDVTEAQNDQNNYLNFHCTYFNKAKQLKYSIFYFG